MRPREGWNLWFLVLSSLRSRSLFLVVGTLCSHGPWEHCFLLGERHGKGRIENRAGSTIDHFMDLIESKTIQEREGSCFH